MYTKKNPSHTNTHAHTSQWLNSNGDMIIIHKHAHTLIHTRAQLFILGNIPHNAHTYTLNIFIANKDIPASRRNTHGFEMHHRGDVIRMSRESSQKFPIGNVPHANRAVGAAAIKSTPVTIK